MHQVANDLWPVDGPGLDDDDARVIDGERAGPAELFVACDKGSTEFSRLADPGGAGHAIEVLGVNNVDIMVIASRQSAIEQPLNLTLRHSECLPGDERDALAWLECRAVHRSYANV
jgi:hypothetical protein